MKASAPAHELLLTVNGVRRRFLLAAGGEAVVIGRAPDAPVRIDTPLVSRRHCAIRLGERGLELRDLGSLNGTFLNGDRVGAVAPLHDGDKVRVGDFDVVVSVKPAAADTACERCGRLISMATLEDGETFELGERILCGACRSGANPIRPELEARLGEALEAEGFSVLGRVSPRVSTCPVFKVRRRDLDDVVAIKVLPLDEATGEKKLERFKAEARVMAQLKHPNVVPVYEVRHRPTLSLLVMEFVPGETLLQRIERKKRLRAHEVVRHATGLAAALEAAQKLGVVHRNVKPSNVLVERDSGEARLIDFGLARNLKVERPNLTDTTGPLGTIRYMAPEQLRDAHEADGRSDIYSLAATLFHALTGKLPHHERNELELLQAAEQGRALPFDLAREAEIPQAFKNVLACALMPDRADRQPTATVLLDELRAAASRVPFEEERHTTTKGLRLESGSFAGAELIERVRIFGATSRTGTLEVKAGVRGGRLVFSEGRIIEARTLAGQRGVEAAHELLALYRGEWFFKPGVGVIEAGDEKPLSTHQLVLEAQRRREMLETHHCE